jgi:hypothetical protein
VRLSQPNLAPRDGWFHLSPREGIGHQTESVLELLNSRRTVVPFSVCDDDSMLLLARYNIDWVAVSPNLDAALVAPPGIERNQRQRVELRFLDESRVEATIEWFSESGEDRLSDFLNVSDTFFVARTDFGTLICNKYRIREARVVAGAAVSVPAREDVRPSRAG